MRIAFIKKLTELVEKKDNIYLLTADTGFKVFDQFKMRFSKRYLNVGISEASMVGIASGLALNGKIVFIYAIVPFVTMRCFEQVRDDLCYQKLPVVLVGVGQGLTYGAAGATHHSIEDIAIMNCLPNMTVICPGDPFEVSKAVENSIKLQGPCYIRLGKTGEKSLHRKPFPEFTIGRGIPMYSGRDIAIFATGNMLETALEVRRILEAEKIESDVISMHTIKPLDRGLVIRKARQRKMLVTIEEHNIIGGLGSCLSDVITEEGLKVRLEKFAIKDRYSDIVGGHEYLRRYFGLTARQISKRIKREFLKI